MGKIDCVEKNDEKILIFLYEVARQFSQKISYDRDEKRVYVTVDLCLMSQRIRALWSP